MTETSEKEAKREESLKEISFLREKMNNTKQEEEKEECQTTQTNKQ